MSDQLVVAFGFVLTAVISGMVSYMAGARWEVLMVKRFMQKLDNLETFSAELKLDAMRVYLENEAK